MHELSLLTRSFACAFRGIARLIITQQNARWHVAATVGVAAAGIALRISIPEWIAITIAIGLVFAAEALNTAIEILSDIVNPERSERVRDLKDIAAGGVFVTAVSSVVVAALVFVPKLWW